MTDDCDGRELSIDTRVVEEIRIEGSLDLGEEKNSRSTQEKGDTFHQS